MEKDLKIFKSKALADGSKYFSLFEKHIPALNAGSSVYLYMLGNLHCICEIIQKNPTSKYFICDADEVINAVQIVMDSIDISKTVDVYDIDMKFDCVIMNPPYQKNLHLKILAEAIKHLKDDDSVCVNLSPVKWLQNPLAKYKKNSDYNRFEDSISKHIESLNTITKYQMTNLFVQCNCDAAIYVINNHLNNFDYSNFNINVLLKHFVYDTSISKMSSVIEHNQINGIRVRCGSFGMANGGGSTRENSPSIKLGKFEYVHYLLMRIYKDGYSVDNNKFWSEDRAPGGGNKAKPIGTPIPTSVKFASINEALNFVNSTKTNFIRTLTWLSNDVESNSDYIIPWMGDSINPRTGLKGYESEWTDEDFYKFFNITDDEIKIIEDTMAKYAK